MTETHRRIQTMIRKCIKMSQILIKMITMHGGPFTRQSKNLTLERLNYFTEYLSIFDKSTRTKPQKIPVDIKKNVKQSHWKKVYMRRWRGFDVKVWFRRKIPGKN